MYLVGFSENDPNFSSSWLISDNENGMWTWVGPSGPVTSLRGNICQVHEGVVGGERRGEGESAEILGSVGELDEGEGEGWQTGR